MYKKNLIISFIVIVLVSIMTCIPIYAMEKDMGEEQDAIQKYETLLKNETDFNSVNNEVNSQNSFALINSVPYDTISGTIETKQDLFTYQIEIDFSRTSQAAICLIQTGDGSVKAEIKDSDNNLITQLSAGKTSLSYLGNYACMSRFVFDKPDPDVDLYTYYITVSCPYSNVGIANSYNINYGDSLYLEDMITGRHNMVTLHYFRNRDESDSSYGNFYSSNRTPGIDTEHWYKFRHQFNKTVVTIIPLRENTTPIRFKIIDPSTELVVYDSNFDPNAHRTEWIIGEEPVEKAKFDNSDLEIGKEYYLVIYSPFGSTSPIGKYYNLFVGEGSLLSDSVTVYSNISVTGTYTNYSTPVNIKPTDVPKNTAYVTNVSLKSATPGITMSKIDPFEVRLSTDYSWIRNLKFNYKINIPYKYGQTSNKPLASTWQVRFKSASS